MKKINWKSSGSRKPPECTDFNPYIVSAQVGSVCLSCRLCFNDSLPRRKLGWMGFVCIRGTMFGRYTTKPKFRQSLSKSKEDAIQLSKELLLDHQAALYIEMRNFDLEQQ